MRFEHQQGGYVRITNLPAFLLQCKKNASGPSRSDRRGAAGREATQAIRACSSCMNGARSGGWFIESQRIGGICVRVKSRVTSCTGAAQAT